MPEQKSEKPDVNNKKGMLSPHKLYLFSVD